MRLANVCRIEGDRGVHVSRNMSILGTVAIVLALLLFLQPFSGRREVDFKDGPPLAWLWAIACLASGLISLLVP